MSVFRAFLPPLTSMRPLRSRIEPNPVSGDPAVGLQAAVADPLWLLGRQWQVGEFAGEDTGTPLAVEITAEFEPLTAWHPGPLSGGGDWLPLPPGAPLEALVEREVVAVAGTRARDAAAWALQDELSRLGETRAVDALLARCPLPPPDVPPDATPAADAVGVGSFLAERLLDPATVAEAFADGEPDWFATALRAGAARRAAARAAITDWLAWWEAEFAATGSSSWVAGVLEYGFAVATATRVLEAPAYAGGEIGWASLDAVPDETPPGPREPPVTFVRRVLASRLGFAGMPASRFWEFEDAAIDLGSVWADPHELARVLVVEAAIVTGDDWLVLPVDTPPGGILRVAEVRWRDTFGSEWVAPERRSVAGAGRRRAPWRIFATTEGGRRDGEVGDGRREIDGLVVPPASAPTLEAPPIEDVRFVRDETANLVWAIVQTVPGGSGDPVPVTARPAPAPAPIAPGETDPGEVLGYELMSFVPDTWRPYVPRLGDDGVTLHRARLASPGGAPPGGVLLDEEAQRVIRAAEVPREGVRVQRVPRVARRADGTWDVWIGRRVRPGYGEGESALRFDATRRPSPDRGA